MNVTPSCIHLAENDIRLPESIRGGHYIHYRHFCAVLGCEHAPYETLSTEFSRLGEFIMPFPILCKGEISQIESIIANDSLMSERCYSDINVSVSSLLEKFSSNAARLLYSTTLENGYPIKKILQAVAYIIADNNERFGKRLRKGYMKIIENHTKSNSTLSVIIRKPDLMTPLVILGNGRGALVGAENPKVYEKLVARSIDNNYKLLVRPITEEDLQNA